MNFWKELPKPFTALAPLDGVTDVVFRQVIAEIGKPDVLFTEFTACDGLVSKGGRKRVLENFLITPEQKPIVAQIWGTKPENYFKAAQDVHKLGFAGVDINMGCPVHVITRHGACSALIKNPKLAGEIIQATKEGAGDLPISVKTRIGFNKEAIDEWLGFVLRQKIAALTVHLRTAAEMSKVPAHWELMPQVVKLRNEIAPETILLGNGDLTSLEEIQTKFTNFGCDGFMIGRGIFANPWVFNPDADMHTKSVAERVALYLHHITLFEKQWGGKKNFALLKKFAKTYISNFDGATDLREQLMKAQKVEDLRKTLEDYPTH